MVEQPTIFHVEIVADTLAALKAFTDEIQPDLGCRAVARKREGQFVADAYMPEVQLEVARAARTAHAIVLRVVENSTEVGLRRQEDVGQGNRYATSGNVPRGLGRKE
ncbi:hypothetical protein [Nocardia amamiensis]|uniref:hypothetical protein n=1 Tax=Nocardia amamiensis TaxID=404578 RepID=UPI000AA037B1|nr:hypothetical protein [Nocardia amamiensis]